MLINEVLPDIDIENYTVEFKARLSTGLDKKGEDNELKWLKEMVAFSNSQGGTLVVGVNNQSHEIEPLSRQEIDKAALLVYQKIEERIEPSINPTLKEVPVGGDKSGQYLLRIDVPKSKNTPVYVHVNGVPACYVRQFGRSKIASPEQIANLVIQGTRAAYDSLMTNEIYDESDFKILKKKFEEANPGKSFNPKLLESIGFMDGRGHLTKGALLFKDHCDDPITLTKASCFPSFDKGGDIVSACESYQGCLLEVIEKTISFVKNHSSIGYQKTANSRIDLSSYPERSLFEGIVNAFAHRNYFVSGTEIQVDIFPDRLEITSPGSLMGGKNLNREKDISSILPKRRNDVVCRVFELVRFMEAKGTGLDKIAQDYLSAGDGHQPFISCNDDFFTLTLPDLTFKEGVIGEDNPYPEIKLIRQIASPYDEKILSCCYVKARSLVEIASYLGISPSTHLRKEILGGLVEQGYLFSRRSGKAYYYLTNRSRLDVSSFI